MAQYPMTPADLHLSDFLNRYTSQSEMITPATDSAMSVRGRPKGICAAQIQRAQQWRRFGRQFSVDQESNSSGSNRNEVNATGWSAPKALKHLPSSSD